MNTFNGLDVIESVWLTESGEPYQVRRTWRERLFSRPWRPFVSTRTIVTQIPSRAVVKLGPHTIVVHPQTLRELRQMSPVAANPQENT